jgi:hypothetical protein
MRLQELIELAILDAMGLLDEEERVLFESAFRAAAPAVQAQVRREQTRLSRIEMLLPDVAPPAGLRALVLKAVRDEMAKAPSSGDLLIPAIVKSRGVSPLWRAASLGLAAAVLVMAITMFLFQREHSRAFDEWQRDSLVRKMVEELGASFVRDVLFNDEAQRVVLASSAPDFKGQASVFLLNPDSASARFFCDAMPTPAGRKYKLVVLDSEGTVVHEVTEFTSSGGLVTVEVNIDIKHRQAGNGLAIVAGEKHGIVLSSGTIG